jgi:hypothetical protein
VDADLAGDFLDQGTGAWRVLVFQLVNRHHAPRKQRPALLNQLVRVSDLARVLVNQLDLGPLAVDRHNAVRGRVPQAWWGLVFGLNTIDSIST